MAARSSWEHVVNLNPNPSPAIHRGAPGALLPRLAGAFALVAACVPPPTSSPGPLRLEVVSPRAGAPVSAGRPVVVCVAVHHNSIDPGSVDLAVQSDRDGPLSASPASACAGGTHAVAVSLSDQDHTLTVEATAGARSGQAQVAVAAAPNAAPTCALSLPATAGALTEQDDLDWAAVVADDGPPGDLALALESDLDGALAAPRANASGLAQATVGPLSAGLHTLTLRVLDPRGGQGACSVGLPVAACVDEDDDGVTQCAGDCDDSSAATAPGLPELEDGQDNDCDGVVDEGTSVFDDDGDGWTESEGDCDDAEPSVYPGASDPPYDGVDADCAGDDDFDADADGVASDGWGGADCDDADASVYPGAPDAPYDGVDADCAGDDDYDADGDGAVSDLWGGTDCDDADAAISPLAPELRDGVDNDCDTYCDEGLLAAGDLVITEIMANPLAVSDRTGEWFEVANVTSLPITLCSGWTGTDDRFDLFNVATDLQIAPGDVAVFVRNGDSGQNGGVMGDYTTGQSFQIAESDDQIVLTFDDPVLGPMEMSRVDYDGAPLWPTTEGASISLDPAAWTEADNDDPSNWCDATSTYGQGDLGTPGAVNDGC